MVDETLQQIRAACDALDTGSLSVHSESLYNYIKLLEKWNKAYNLTAVRELKAMVIHHLLDSLVVLPWLRGLRFLDVGTGAGLPGIPLAIAAPQREFTLLDSNGKKVRFLRQAVEELGLSNVRPIQKRAQHLVDKPGFDMVLSRAFASLVDMVAGTGHLLAEDGRWLAMKGVYPHEEIAALPAEIELETVAPVQVPGLEAQRHLVILQRRQPEPQTGELH